MNKEAGFPATKGGGKQELTPAEQRLVNVDRSSAFSISALGKMESNAEYAKPSDIAGLKKGLRAIGSTEEEQAAVDRALSGMSTLRQLKDAGTKAAILKRLGQHAGEIALAQKALERLRSAAILPEGQDHLIHAVKFLADAATAVASEKDQAEAATILGARLDAAELAKVRKDLGRINVSG